VSGSAAITDAADLVYSEQIPATQLDAQLDGQSALDGCLEGVSKHTASLPGVTSLSATRE